MVQVLEKPRMQTLHDQAYQKVVQAVEQARKQMAPGQICKDISCPICGGQAFILYRAENNGKTPIAMCQEKHRCFFCRE